MKFKKGDRVKYTSGAFPDVADNPLWDGEYGQIVGTVNRFDQEDVGGVYILVDWDNGEYNWYDDDDLVIYKPEIKITIDEGLFDL